MVVLSFNRFQATSGPCLETLRDAFADPSLELVLVDNGSRDGARESCSEFAMREPGVRFLPQSENLGFAGGMNAGVDVARGEWVCLVNSDTLFPAGALAALKATLQGVPSDVAMVGPVTNAAGNGQCLPLPGSNMSAAVAIGEAAMRGSIGVLTPTYRTDFFCVAIRRKVWLELGGLDTSFGLGYYEDFDFSLRLRQAGWQQVIAEDVFIAHVGSASFSVVSSQQRELLRRNRALMRERYPDVNFEHAREGNAMALRHLIRVAQDGGWNKALRARAAWRLASLLADEPRSPLKRLRWRWRVRDIRRALASSSIEPQYPAPVCGHASPRT
jgi:GT2 family glycosyltransferase